jgi:predicted dehydrogenase
VVVTGGWHHPGEYPFSMEFTVTMDRATLEFSSAGRPLALYGAGTLPKMAERDAYTAEIEYFLDCCRSGREPELCPPAESAAAVKLIRLMLEARRQKGVRFECSNLG